MPNCCVVGCGRRPADNRSKMKKVTAMEEEEFKSKLGFFSIPAVIKTQGIGVQKRTERRQGLWFAAISKEYLNPESLKNKKVCGFHFIKGKPAKPWEVDDPDWVPTQNLNLEQIERNYSKTTPSSSSNQWLEDSCPLAQCKDKSEIEIAIPFPSSSQQGPSSHYPTAEITITEIETGISSPSSSQPDEDLSHSTHYNDQKLNWEIVNAPSSSQPDVNYSSDNHYYAKGKLISDIVNAKSSPSSSKQDVDAGPSNDLLVKEKAEIEKVYHECKLLMNEAKSRLNKYLTIEAGNSDEEQMDHEDVKVRFIDVKPQSSSDTYTVQAVCDAWTQTDEGYVSMKNIQEELQRLLDENRTLKENISILTCKENVFKGDGLEVRKLSKKNSSRSQSKDKS